MALWGAVIAVWDFFLPPDPPLTDMFGPEATMAKIEGHMKSLRIWRIKVTCTLIAGLGLAAIAVFTPWGFVRAGDLVMKIEDSVKKSSLSKSVEEIKTEQQTMKTQLSEMKATIDSMAPALKEILKASTASTICRLVAGKLRQEADVEQTKYKAITGEYYPESRCGGK